MGVPASVRAVVGERALTPVWRNVRGGLTFEFGDGVSRSFVKWAPAGSGLDLDAEIVRLRWASEYLSVPRVLDRGEADDGCWMVTAGLPGQNAVGPRWRARPAEAVRATGAGLRALHDVLPVADCPFSWSVEERLRAVVAHGHGPPATFPPAPDIDELVVCHGDPCVPNFLLDGGDVGVCSGYVDLSALGVADRWADIAVASWSTEWNYGPGWEPTFMAAYGIEPDAERISYYRSIWELD